MSIKPIETVYHGARFRSRQEARWAVFFDHLGIPWEYEPEGFETPHGRYLPDFLLHLEGGDVWFEVKPSNEPDDSDPRWWDVAEGTDKRLLVARGMPDADDLAKGFEYDEHITLEGPSGWDDCYAFCLCPTCGRVGIEFEGRGLRVCAATHGESGGRGHTSDAPRILAAYRAAKSARFEFGESGAR